MKRFSGSNNSRIRWRRRLWDGDLEADGVEEQQALAAVKKVSSGNNSLGTALNASQGFTSRVRARWRSRHAPTGVLLHETRKWTTTGSSSWALLCKNFRSSKSFASGAQRLAVLTGPPALTGLFQDDWET